MSNKQTITKVIKTSSGPNNSKAMSKRGKKRKPKQKSTYSKEERAPVAVSISTKTMAPKMSYGPNAKSCIIRHSEFIGTLQNSSDPNFHILKRLRVNPGSAGTFAWLSQVAGSWEFYRFRKLNFRFITRCPSTSPGVVLYVPDYDAADTVPTSEQAATQYDGAVESSVWKNMSISLRPDRMNALYKRHAIMDDTRFATSAQDEKTIDAGQFMVFSDSATASLIIGKLWVDYEVELMIPQSLIQPPNNVGGELISSTSVQAGTVPFISNAISANSVGELDPIVSKLPDTSFPGKNLLKFNKDFTGLLNTSALGSGITAIGSPLINGGTAGVTNLTSAIINAGANTGMRVDYLKALAGDTLGIDSTTATTLTTLGMQLASRANLANVIGLSV